jgi:hypothetical protein
MTSREYLTLVFNERLKKIKSVFIPPGNGDLCWRVEQGNFTREQVCHLLWTQISMINNDLKTHCGKDLTKNMHEIISKPRIPNF